MSIMATDNDNISINIINEHNNADKNIKKVDLGTNVSFKKEFNNLSTEPNLNLNFDSETIKDCVKLNKKLMNMTKKEKTKLVNENILEKEKIRMNMIINALNVGTNKNEANKFYNILTNNNNNWRINKDNIEKKLLDFNSKFFNDLEERYKNGKYCSIENSNQIKYNTDMNNGNNKNHNNRTADKKKIIMNTKPIQFDVIKKMIFEKERKFREKIEIKEKFLNSEDYHSKNKDELIEIIDQKNDQIEYLTFTIEKMRYKIINLENEIIQSKEIQTEFKNQNLQIKNLKQESNKKFNNNSKPNSISKDFNEKNYSENSIDKYIKPIYKEKEIDINNHKYSNQINTLNYENQNDLIDIDKVNDVITSNRVISNDNFAINDTDKTMKKDINKQMNNKNNNEILLKTFGNKNNNASSFNNAFSRISPKNNDVKKPFNEILVRNAQNIQIFNSFKEILNKSQKLFGS